MQIKNLLVAVFGPGEVRTADDSIRTESEADYADAAGTNGRVNRGALGYRKKSRRSTPSLEWQLDLLISYPLAISRLSFPGLAQLE
jgi:hypothetical protein